MSRPDIQERVQTLEDEVTGLESMVDSRTRKLWAEIQKLQFEFQELRERNDVSASKAQEGYKNGR